MQLVFFPPMKQKRAFVHCPPPSGECPGPITLFALLLAPLRTQLRIVFSVFLSFINHDWWTRNTVWLRDASFLFHNFQTLFSVGFFFLWRKKKSDQVPHINIQQRNSIKLLSTTNFLCSVFCFFFSFFSMNSNYILQSLKHNTFWGFSSLGENITSGTFEITLVF